ncbi:MAG: hypothetical protein HWE11_05620 [Gammaproteobacteria bacterium]|nr:hypothetical protein [Gammaproteobacteria bacterium]
MSASASAAPISALPAIPRAHHHQAYRALAQSLILQPPLPRREQLDAWLLKHGISFELGLDFETRTLDARAREDFWQNEYRQVVRDALQGAMFYSDAFQQRLYVRYIQCERVSESAARNIHHAELLRLSQLTPAKAAPTLTSLVLVVSLVMLPLIFLL